MPPPPRAVWMVAYARYPEDPRVRREAETLARRGLAVHVVCLRAVPERSTEFVRGVEVHRVPLTARRGGRLRYLYQYGLFLLLAGAVLARRRARGEAVHVHSLPDFLVFLALPARLRGDLVVLDLHEAMPEILATRLHLPEGAPLVRLARAVEVLSSLVAHRVVTVSDHLRDLLVARGVPADRVVVVYNSPSEVPRDLPAPSHRLVYAGGLNAERDLGTLLRAASRLPGLPLLVLGRGDSDYVRELERLADALGIRDRVTFAGQVPSDRALTEVAASAAGLVTYARNPLTELAAPNKAFEAALLRRPLVVADLPELRRLFDGAASFYAPGNPEDLARAIRDALEGPDVPRRVARALEVAREFSWERMERRLLAAYGLRAEGS